MNHVNGLINAIFLLLLIQLFSSSFFLSFFHSFFFFFFRSAWCRSLIGYCRQICIPKITLVESPNSLRSMKLACIFHDMVCLSGLAVYLLAFPLYSQKTPRNVFSLPVFATMTFIAHNEKKEKKRY